MIIFSLGCRTLPTCLDASSRGLSPGPLPGSNPIEQSLSRAAPILDRGASYSSAPLPDPSKGSSSPPSVSLSPTIQKRLPLPIPVRKRPQKVSRAELGASPSSLGEHREAKKEPDPVPVEGERGPAEGKTYDGVNALVIETTDQDLGEDGGITGLEVPAEPSPLQQKQVLHFKIQFVVNLLPHFLVPSELVFSFFSF